MESETGKSRAVLCHMIDKWVAVDEPILNLDKLNYWQGRRYIHQQFCAGSITPERALPPEVPRRQSISERQSDESSMVMRWLIWICDARSASRLNIKGVTQMIAQVRCSNAKCKHVNNIRS